MTLGIYSTDLLLIYLIFDLIHYEIGNNFYRLFDFLREYSQGSIDIKERSNKFFRIQIMQILEFTTQ